MKWILVGTVAVLLLMFFIMKPSFQKSGLDTTKPQETHASVEKKQATQAKSTKNTSINDKQVQQPDKSLPVPAQKLQKMLSEGKKDESLDERIAAANQDIAEIDRQLAQAGYKPEDNSTPLEPDAESEELNERIQNIRDHVNK